MSNTNRTPGETTAKRTLVTANAFSQTLRQTSFAVTETGGGFSVKYHTLPGTNPSKNGYFVAVWQSPGAIPWTEPFIAQAPVPGTTSTGSFPWSFPVQDKDYTFGYAVGTEVKNICATYYIPAGGGDPEQFSPTLGIFSLDTDSVLVAYQMPPGCTPQTYGHWVGLWEGANPRLDTKPLAKQAITSDFSKNKVGLGYAFEIDQDYTVVYFAGDKVGNAACSLTFDTTRG